jgi:hypothetical protein
MHSSALVVAAALLAPPHAARVDVGHRISIRVPSGWHVIRRPLTDVQEPALRLAVASPGVKALAGRCDCDTPGVRDPARGAFVVMWESPAPDGGSRWRIPRRPARFHVTGRARSECVSSWYSLFLDAGRYFNVEVSLGPRAGRRVRARVDALLDSLRVGSGDYFHAEPVLSRGGVRILDREHSL